MHTCQRQCSTMALVIQLWSTLSPSWVILATKRQNLPAWLKLWIGGWLRCWLADTHGNAVGDVTYT